MEVIHEPRVLVALGERVTDIKIGGWGGFRAGLNILGERKIACTCCKFE
jgi:hypothetical protein